MRTNNDLASNNQNAHFWELEDPEVMETGKNALRYYPKAQRLVVHLSDYHDARTGELKPGKGTGLNLAALAESPEVLDRVLEILSGLKD
jgi:hypothetical protein